MPVGPLVITACHSQFVYMKSELGDNRENILTKGHFRKGSTMFTSIMVFVYLSTNILSCILLNNTLIRFSISFVRNNYKHCYSLLIALFDPPKSEARNRTRHHKVEAGYQEPDRTLDRVPTTW